MTEGLDMGKVERSLYHLAAICHRRNAVCNPVALPATKLVRYHVWD